ncbi:MAG: 50S ribosomal protein L10 [Candidatus Babeliales bacterium]
MNRQEKEQVISTLKHDFNDSQAAFLVSYQGLDVVQMSNLRHALREKGGTCKVAKVTLMRRGIEQVPEVAQLEPFVKDQVALVFAHNEPASIAKVLLNFAKDNEKLQLVAGCYESQLLDAKAIKALATLPSKEVLLGQVCGLLQAPATGIACSMNAVMRQLLVAITKVAEKQAN